MAQKELLSLREIDFVKKKNPRFENLMALSLVIKKDENTYKIVWEQNKLM
jgi:hypothetical protein